MRHLDKSYPYTKPSPNRSSKDANLILGPASVFPNYTGWADSALKYFASKCKNKTSNCYLDELARRKKQRELTAAKRAAKLANEQKQASNAK